MRKVKFVTKSTISGDETFSLNIFDGENKFAVHIIPNGDNMKIQIHNIGSLHNDSFDNIMKYYRDIKSFINYVEKRNSIFTDERINEKINDNIDRYGSTLAEFVKIWKNRSEKIESSPNEKCGEDCNKTKDNESIQQENPDNYECRHDKKGRPIYKKYDNGMKISIRWRYFY